MGAIFGIISLIIQIIKLWFEYRKRNPTLAKECKIGIDEARKKGDFKILEAILEKLKAGQC